MNQVEKAVSVLEVSSPHVNLQSDLFEGVWIPLDGPFQQAFRLLLWLEAGERRRVYVDGINRLRNGRGLEGIAGGPFRSVARNYKACKCGDCGESQAGHSIAPQLRGASRLVTAGRLARDRLLLRHPHLFGLARF